MSLSTNHQEPQLEASSNESPSSIFASEEESTTILTTPTKEETTTTLKRSREADDDGESERSTRSPPSTRHSSISPRRSRSSISSRRSTSTNFSIYEDASEHPKAVREPMLAIAFEETETEIYYYHYSIYHRDNNENDAALRWGEYNRHHDSDFDGLGEDPFSEGRGY